MGEPINRPSRLGEPCWTDANLEATIRTVAAMGDESVSRFLSTHAPIRHLRLGDGDENITDTDAFGRISKLSARENVVLVYGDPGTGKSHLINWIKLQYDLALEREDLANILPVLVRRRTGSLKDALEQLVEQLPDRFQSYLEPVRTAINRISEREARTKLATGLHLELGIRRDEAGLEPLPRTIRDIPQIFHSEGFGAWLCRDGGVIDRNIQHLISPSDVGDRESFPPFTAAEFLIQNVQQRSRALNTASVMRLIDEFEDDEALAERAAELCNASLRSAMRELTGLGNAALSGVLRSIRQDLKKDNIRLILLIEDVSTLSVLDDEVVNAVEPQDDATLCDLTSILGMTEQAYRRLRDNQYQRIAGSGLILSFPQDPIGQTWAKDDGDTNRFIARYLNAARLDDPFVATIADQRLAGGDVGVSACDDCPVMDECHRAFGSVALDETVIGLFPFRPQTAPYLLRHLKVSQTGVRATQRGLLDHITKPVLRHVQALQEGDRRQLGLPIEPHQPTDWQPLADTFLGGWGNSDQARFRLLVQAWTDKQRAAEIAGDLKPLLSPFALPDFSAKTAAPEPQKTVAEIATKSPVAGTRTDPADVFPPAVPVPIAEQDPVKQKKITTLLNRLHRWFDGEKLEQPQEYQDRLLKFLKGALPLDDIRSPAVPAQKRFKDAKRGTIRIEDSVTNAATTGVEFNFPRTKDSFDLIVALSYYDVQGEDSWNFPEAERYKRMTAAWLRKHQDAMLRALDPSDLSTSLPVKTAAKFLCFASIVERRAGIPSDTPDAIALLTVAGKRQAPMVLSDSLRQLYDDLPERRNALQEFLVEECNLPQGTGGINVIDPILLAEAITDARTNPAVEALPEAYFTSFWKTRYQSLQTLKNWATLPNALQAEREAIGEFVGQADLILASYGYETGGFYEGVTSFIADTARLFELLKSVFKWPSTIDFFRTDRLIDRGGSFAQTLARASAVAEGDDYLEILTFDPSELLAVVAYLDRCRAIIDQAGTEAESKLEQISIGGDPDIVQDEIVSALKRIAGVEEGQPS